MKVRGLHGPKNFAFVSTENAGAVSCQKTSAIHEPLAFEPMKNIKPLLSILVTAAAVLAQVTARADDAATIQTFPINTGVFYDGNGNFPIVTAILSAPTGTIYNAGTVLDGFTNRNWSYLAQDPSGSLDMFYSSSIAVGYVPHVGDQITVQGNYSPFSGIPEIANSAAHPLSVNFGSSGNPFYTPVPFVTTIPTINVGTNGGGISLSGLGGALLELDNVTISNPTTNGVSTAGYWGFHANVTGTITDPGNNNMTMFLWCSSYTTCASIQAAGGLIPTGPVNMTGFISDFFNSTLNGGQIVAEFVPVSITSVPEPMAINLCGFGAALAWVCYRMRKKG